MSVLPSSYDEWKHCITVACDIPLTAGYVEERIAALLDDGDYHTQTFKKRWGTEHHARTVEWFQRAKRELAESG